MTMDDRTREAEFADFVSGGALAPPPHLSERIRSSIALALNPSPWIIFAKLVGFVLFAGSATLHFCPHFGLTSTGPASLMGFFMRVGGMPACQMACGALFMGSALFAAALVLRPEELRVLSRTRFLQVGTLSALSLGAFVCAGTSLLISLFLSWFTGALLGGVLSLELGYAIRRRLVLGACAKRQ